jgi:hypothetical protein
MAKILKAPKGHAVPRLLQAFADWFETQDDSALGFLEINVGKAYWTDAASMKRLNADGFKFIETGDGSQLVLLQRGGGKTPLVCLLGSEGATETVAGSLEEFLTLLAKGATGVMDLDGEATGRRQLKAWLKQHKVKVPRAERFDFSAYLEGKNGEIEKKAKATAPTGTLISLLGKTLEEVAASSFLKSLKEKPRSKRGANGYYMSLEKSGVEFATSFDAAVTSIFCYGEGREKKYKQFQGVLPENVQFSDSRASIRKRLGKPSFSGEAKVDPTFGKQNPWDTYDRAAYRLVIEYSEREDRIVLVGISSHE